MFYSSSFRGISPDVSTLPSEKSGKIPLRFWKKDASSSSYCMRASSYNVIASKDSASDSWESNKVRTLNAGLGCREIEQIERCSLFARRTGGNAIPRVDVDYQPSARSLRIA